MIFEEEVVEGVPTTVFDVERAHWDITRYPQDTRPSMKERFPYPIQYIGASPFDDRPAEEELSTYPIQRAEANDVPLDPVFFVGSGIGELSTKLVAMENSINHGEKAQLQLLTTNMPSKANLDAFYHTLKDAGFHTSMPVSTMVEGIPSTTIVLRKGSPIWTALIAALPVLAIVSVIAFGIIKVEDVSKAIMPILLVTIGGAIIIAALITRNPQTKQAAIARGSRLVAGRVSAHTVPLKKKLDPPRGDKGYQHLVRLAEAAVKKGADPERVGALLADADESIDPSLKGEGRRAALRKKVDAFFELRRLSGFSAQTLPPRGQMPAVQRASLQALGHFTIIYTHDDGDLTVRVGEKQYIVATNGEVFVHAGNLGKKENGGNGHGHQSFQVKTEDIELPVSFISKEQWAEWRADIIDRILEKDKEHRWTKAQLESFSVFEIHNISKFISHGHERFQNQTDKPNRRAATEGDLQFLADSPEYLANTIDCCGWRDKLENEFNLAIARTGG